MHILRTSVPYKLALINLRNSLRYQSTQVQHKELKGIKKLISVYGYSALIVYIGVTFISLPGCYFTVHSLGEERISILLNRVKQVFGYGESDDNAVKIKVKEKQKQRLEARNKYIADEEEEQLKENGVNGTNRSMSVKWKLRWESIKTSPILTELILAYGLHKSLIFIRIPLTAAITPTLARYLPRKVGQSFNKSTITISNITAKNKSTTANDSIYPRQQKTGFQKWFNGLF